MIIIIKKNIMKMMNLSQYIKNLKFTKEKIKSKEIFMIKKIMK